MKLSKIIALMLMVIAPMVATAQNGDVEYTSESFVLEGRKVTVRGADAETSDQIAAKLAGGGAIVVSDIFSKVFLPGVTLSKVKHIDNQTNAFNINVNSSRVLVKYTSEQSLSLALVELNELFDSAYGDRIIRGCNIAYRGEKIKRRKVLNSNDFGVYDGVSKHLSSAKVEKAMGVHFAEEPQRAFILAMSNSSVFRAEFESLEGLNPEFYPLEKDGYYSAADIREFVEYAKRSGGEFVPAIDLLSDNEQFAEYTGHEIDSVEGMRFVRAMIEEAAREWGVKELCIGTLAKADVKPYYIEFLKDIAHRNSIELIML